MLHILEPEEITTPWVNFLVLGLSMIFEGGSWYVAYRQFGKEKGDLGFLKAIKRSKDPTTFTVLVEDTVALTGLVIALVGITAALWFRMPELDGVASVGIGLLLGATAFFLARESKNLLIGESALPEVREAILALAEADPAIRRANEVTTSQMGPNQVVAALSAEFEDHLTTEQIEDCIERLEKALRETNSEVVALFVKPQTPTAFAERVRERQEELAPQASPSASSR